MDWFTSDWHLDHTGIISISKRPFSTAEEMNEVILHNMLSAMKKGDNLFFLGDLAIKDETLAKTLETFKKRKINFFWILGNHDVKRLKKAYYPLCHTIDKELIIKREHTTLHLSHFPLATWEKSFYNGFQLYGHLHKFSPEREALDTIITGKRLNVNVEFNDYKPFSLKDVFEIMENKPDNWDAILLKNYYAKSDFSQLIDVD